MENQQIMQFVDDTIRDEIRKGNILKTKDILPMLSAVVETVRLNEKKMDAAIEQCLSTENPLNAILDVFGARIVRKDRLDRLRSHAEDKIESSFSINTDQWLALNQENFRESVEKIAHKLYEIERKADQAYENEKKRGDELFDKYEALSREYEQLKARSEINEKMIAERIQYMLSVSGREVLFENEQLLELLKDMKIEVYWDSTDAPFPDAAMFTEYRIDDEVYIATKPCFIREGEVYLQGIRMVIKKDQ